MTDRELHTSRIVIVGAGLAALYTALNLAPRPVLIISPEALGQGACSSWAQGGIAAAVSPQDSPAAHAKDTVRAGAGIVDQTIATLVTEAAGLQIERLIEMGTNFDRGAGGDFLLSKEAAHSVARIVRVKGDQAGAAIMQSLIRRVRSEPSIQVLEHVMAIMLDVRESSVTGLCVQSSTGCSDPVVLRGNSYVLAGGGSCGLYAVTTNPTRVRGEIIGMAARAGALIADPEFVQFHPTAFDVDDDPAPLATEALRGQGAVLINAQGERFMTEIHPDAELAPRNIVAQAVYSQKQKGLRPALDLHKHPGYRIWAEFPNVAETCKRHGIDPEREPIPVSAAAHYHMGGIKTDHMGRSSLKNLWACGESACTGLHGANRLASNGLLEALVIARNCALDLTEATDDPGSEEEVDGIKFHPNGELDDCGPIDELRQIMTNYVGVVRNAEGLTFALKEIARLERIEADNQVFQNMTATATLIAAASLLREESRGAHYREDFPRADDSLEMRTRITLKQALVIRENVKEKDYL